MGVNYVSLQAQLDSVVFDGVVTKKEVKFLKKTAEKMVEAEAAKDFVLHRLETAPASIERPARRFLDKNFQPLSASSITLTFLDDWNMTADTVWGPQTPGHLSGLVYDPVSKKFLAVSDDQMSYEEKTRSRGETRYYKLDIPIEGEGDDMTISMSETYYALNLRADGETLTLERGDMESIAFLPNGNLVFSAEGNLDDKDIKTADGGTRHTVNSGPHIDEFTRDGERVSSYPIPGYYQPKFDEDGNQIAGASKNAGFESVTRYGDYVFTTTEGGLVQDGGISTLESGSRSRILQFETREDFYVPHKEFVYETDAIPVPESWGGDIPAQGGDNGVVDMLALSETQFLVLERAFVKKPHYRNHIRLYLVDTSEATNTLWHETIPEGATPVKKELVLDFDTILNQLEPNVLKGLDHGTLENYEGMALTVLPDGTPGIIFICDNNHNVKYQRQSLLLFRIDGLY